MAGPGDDDAPITDAEYRRVLAFRTELRRFLRWSEEAAAMSDLTPALHQLLLAVRGLTGDRAPTIGQLAEVLLTRHHSTVELAGRAERAGLVTRERGADGREVRLRLTATGEERLAEVTRRNLPEIARFARSLEGLEP